MPLLPRAMDDPVPLSALQSRWMKWISQMGSSFRMVAAAVRMLGPLNASFLVRSLDIVVQRHESLRSRIVDVDGVYRQNIDPPREHNLELIDLAHMSETDSRREAAGIAREIIDRRIDVSVGPLFEAKLLKLSDDDHVLLSVVDHLVSDAASCEIINREVWALYDQAEQGAPFSLPQLPVQFGDYAVWQERMHDTWQRQHEAYWKGRTSGAPDTRIPQEGSSEPDHPIVAMLYVALGNELSAGLRKVALREGVPLSTVVLAVYASVMSRWCDQDDLILTFVSHGRHRRELKDVIGYFACHLPMRLEIGARDSFLDLLRKVAAEREAARNHQDYAPYFQLECSTDVVFNWVPSSWIRTSTNNVGKKSHRLRRQPFPANFVWPLKFNPFFTDTTAGIGIAIHYRSDFLSTSTIRRFGRNFRMLAEELVNFPLKHVASISVDMK